MDIDDAAEGSRMCRKAQVDCSTLCPLAVGIRRIYRTEEQKRKTRKRDKTCQDDELVSSLVREERGRRPRRSKKGILKIEQRRY